MKGKVLVTGGNGFIGQALCKQLATAGYVVKAMDNYSTSDRRTVVDLERYGVETIHADVTDGEEWPDDRFHYVYNLAGIASPVHYRSLPERTFWTSVTGVRNAAAVAALHKATLLQASTSEVYGDPEQTPQSEDYNGNVSLTGERACYDEGKRAAEVVLKDFDGLKQKRVARIFNTYGPGMLLNDGRVVVEFVRRALTGEPLEVHGDGEQTRSLCFISDTVDALQLLAETEIPYTPVNIGNPHEVTVNEIAETVLSVIGSKSEIVHVPADEDDPRRRCPSIERMRRLTGWAPKVSLEVGLKRTAEYVEQRLRER